MSVVPGVRSRMNGTLISHPPGAGGSGSSVTNGAPASNSAGGISWPDAADFFCGLVKPTTEFANRRNAAMAEIQIVLADMIFLDTVAINANRRRRQIVEGSIGLARKDLLLRWHFLL